jgi:hypothetical protein
VISPLGHAVALACVLALANAAALGLLHLVGVAVVAVLLLYVHAIVRAPDLASTPPSSRSTDTSRSPSASRPSSTWSAIELVSFPERRMRGLRLAGLLMGLAAACSSTRHAGDAGTPSDAPGSPDGGAVGAIRTTAETGHAVEARVGRLGGLLRTTAEDGTRFELWVPAHALAAETQITMTPARVIAPARLADAVEHGVLFEPSGLKFAEPAVLTIRPANAETPTGLVASFEDGASLEPSLETSLEPSWAGVYDGGVVRARVAHFSAIVTLSARLAEYKALVAQAIMSLPPFAQDAGLTADVAGLTAVDGGLASPAALQAVANDLQRLADTVVAPAVADAPDSIPKFAVAGTLVANLFNAVQAVQAGRDFSGVIPLHADGTAGAASVAAIGREFLAPLGQAGEGLYLRYNRVKDVAGSCSAAVAELSDWAVFAVLVVQEMLLVGLNPPELAFCFSQNVEWLAPADLRFNVSESDIDVRLRAGIFAPIQTPGGLPKDGQKFFPMASRVEVIVTGAKIAMPESGLLATSADGVALFRLKRVPAAHSPPVSPIEIIGEINLRDEGADLVDLTGWNVIDIAQTLRPAAALYLTFNPTPATGAILVPTEKTKVCATVTDAESTLLKDVPVAFILEGPGALSESSAPTSESGTACVDFVHPTNVVVEAEKTATIRAQATSGDQAASDRLTLTLRWASIALRIRRHAGADLPVDANEQNLRLDRDEKIVLEAALRGAGRTPDDSSVAIAGETLAMRVEKGSGGFTAGSDPLRADLVTDALGRASNLWDPLGADADTTLSVSYPFMGGGVIARTTLTFGAAVQRLQGGIKTTIGIKTVEWMTTLSLSVDVSGSAPVVRILDGTLHRVTNRGFLCTEFMAFPAGVSAEVMSDSVVVRLLWQGVDGDVDCATGERLNNGGAFESASTLQGTVRRSASGAAVGVDFSKIEVVNTKWDYPGELYTLPLTIVP